METLGAFLRKAREARGLDIREAAQQTRINHHFLKAIEENDFSKLPGEVFVKGFLKSYARFLNLSEDEVMKRYTEARSGAAPAAAAPSAAPAAEQPRQAKARPRPVEQQPAAEEGQPTTFQKLEPFLWAGGIAIALIVFLLTALPKHPAKEKAPEPLSRATATEPLATAPTATAMPGKLYLDIEALEDAWVLVRTDSSPQKKAVLKKGESVTWSADDRFIVSYGAISSIRLVLNGKELEVTGPKNAPVRDLTITAAGVLQPKAAAEPQPKPRKPKTAPTATAKPAQLPAAAPQAVTPQAEAPSPAPAPAPAKPAPDASPFTTQKPTE